MDQKLWEELSSQIAIEIIAMDLADIYIPIIEGRERAKQLQEQRAQKYLGIKYKAGQALIALGKLGYGIFEAESLKIEIEAICNLIEEG